MNTVIVRCPFVVETEKRKIRTGMSGRPRYATSHPIPPPSGALGRTNLGQLQPLGCCPKISQHVESTHTARGPDVPHITPYLVSQSYSVWHSRWIVSHPTLSPAQAIRSMSPVPATQDMGSQTKCPVSRPTPYPTNTNFKLNAKHPWDIAHAVASRTGSCFSIRFNRPIDQLLIHVHRR